jgi:succinate-semialdehyde dehydrogenase/glutarate-semialdehyde dehydrogenase
MQGLKNAELFKQQCLIDGEWLDATSGKRVEVVNPATDKILGTVPAMGAKETHTAIEAAGKAFLSWRKMTASARCQLVRKLYDLMIENEDDLARIMTLEQGKPLQEAKGEIRYSAGFLQWFSEEGKRAYGETIPAPKTTQRIVVISEPIGVTAAITPWNFPSAMITRKIGPALAAGCPVVVKPASQTPYSALALGVLAKEAGFPDGVINIVTGSAREIGGALCESAMVRKLTFTGSTEVGKALLKQCADTVKKTSMELGGHAPFIVFADADLDAAVAGAIASKFRNNGQTCVCANRFYVHEDVYEAFAEKFKAAVSKLKIGNGLESGVDLGPLIDDNAVEKVKEHIQTALDKGAKLFYGGKKLQGRFFEPTILTDCTDNMLISCEETFGPVAPLYRFSEEQEVIARANNTPFGLAAYFYTRDLARTIRVAESLEYGIIGINEGVVSNPEAPFGGMKESGIGREGSHWGLDEFLEVKYLCLGNLS